MLDIQAIIPITKEAAMNMIKNKRVNKLPDSRYEKKLKNNKEVSKLRLVANRSMHQYYQNISSTTPSKIE